MNISRRAWLKGLGALTGSALASRLVDAKAAPSTTTSAVVSIYLEGGFNALFTSADSFVGTGAFGVSSSNVRDVGNGLVVDARSIGTLGDWALGHMAAIGNNHGISAHPAAQTSNFGDGSQSYAVQLAAAIGGDAAFKAVALGELPPGPAPAVEGTSLQLIRSMGDVSSALGLDARTGAPGRADVARALRNAQRMSAPAIASNPGSLSFAKDAYATNLDALAKPPAVIDLAQIAASYGTSSGGALDLVPAKLVAAEAMLRGGTNVVSLQDHGWDSHGDRGGSTVRAKMGQILPALRTFLGRLRSEPDLAARNVTVILHGDFARSLPGSDHASCLSALVIGPRVKVGTTGKVSADVRLGERTGGSREMWSYLATVAQVGRNPFGNNPHALVT